MNDMTTGSITKHLFTFMIPVFLGNLFQTFYNIVDGVIVGRFLGVEPLAAVGAAGMIVFICTGFIQGMTSGCGLLIARIFGAKELNRMKHYIAMSTYICIAMGIVMTGGMMLINHFILDVMKMPAEIYDMAYVYLIIMYLGFPGLLLYNMLAAIARAYGDSKAPLYFLVLSSVVNIILDLWFVGGTPLGVAGAALATILSQIVSGILCFVYMFKKYPEMKFNREQAKFSVKTCMDLCGYGLPMSLQYVILGTGGILVQTVTNQLGTIYIAAFVTMYKIQGMFQQGYMALGTAVANFVGQNYGAMRYGRIKSAVKVSFGFILVMCVIFMAITYYISPKLLVIFVENPSQELSSVFTTILHTFMWFYIFHMLLILGNNVLQGMGKSFFAMLGGVAELVARIIGVNVLATAFGFIGVCYLDPLAWGSAFLVVGTSSCYYLSKIKAEE